MSATSFCIAFGGATTTCPPGHTISAIRKAIEVGADRIYVEVRTTRDHELLAWHSLQRIVGEEAVHLVDYSLAEWRGITQNDDAPVLALDEVLTLVARTGIGITIDLCVPGIENALARMLRRHRLPYESLLVVTSSDASRAVMRSMDPRIPLAHRLRTDHEKITGAKLLSLDVDAVVWPGQSITPEITKTLKERGIAVYACPVFLGEEMRRLRDQCGVDGIVTPHVELLMSVFDKPEQMAGGIDDAFLDAA
jgi:glycerophosphoryl diester phosphodiesterase